MDNYSSIQKQRLVVFVLTLLMLVLGALHEAMADDAKKEPTPVAQPATVQQPIVINNIIVNNNITVVQPVVDPNKSADNSSATRNPPEKHGNVAIGLGYTRFYKERGGSELDAPTATKEAITPVASAYIWSAGDPMLFQADAIVKGYQGYSLSGEQQWGMDSSVNMSLSGITGTRGFNGAIGLSVFGDASKAPGAAWDGNVGLGLEPGMFISNGNFTIMLSGVTGAGVNVTDLANSALGGHVRLGGKLKLMYKNDFYFIAELYRKYSGASVDAPSLYGMFYQNLDDLQNDLKAHGLDAAVRGATGDIPGAIDAIESVPDTINSTFQDIKNTPFAVDYQNWFAGVRVGGQFAPHMGIEGSGQVSDAPLVVRKDNSAVQLVDGLDVRGTVNLSITLK